MALQAIGQSAQSGVNAVQGWRTGLDGLANRYLVRPSTVKGINGFVFDYEGDTEMTAQAEITDHYAEDNTAVQDHIAVKPLRITLHGFVGELVYKAPQGITGLLSLIQNKLTIVPAYLGHYTPQQLAKVQAALTKAQSVVNKADLALAKVRNLVRMLPGATAGDSAQKRAWVQLYSFVADRVTFDVETPYGIMKNMAMESLHAVQDETTTEVTDIVVTLKQLRFVDVEVVSATPDTFGGRSLFQRAPETDEGQTSGQPADRTGLAQLLGIGAN